MTAKAKEMAERNTSAKTPAELLRKPYVRILTPNAESGGYTAEILEFPGCVTEGDTLEEAHANLEAAAEAWIEAALELGQHIPEPLTSHGYAGKIALRLPRSLHRRASEMARRDGTSLNQFLVAAVAERVGAASLFSRIVEQLRQPAVQATVVNVRLGVSNSDPHRTFTVPPIQAVVDTLGTFPIRSPNVIQDQRVEGKRQDG